MYKLSARSTAGHVTSLIGTFAISCSLFAAPVYANDEPISNPDMPEAMVPIMEPDLDSPTSEAPSADEDADVPVAIQPDVDTSKDSNPSIEDNTPSDDTPTGDDSLSDDIDAPSEDAGDSGEQASPPQTDSEPATDAPADTDPSTETDSGNASDDPENSGDVAGDATVDTNDNANEDGSEATDTTKAPQTAETDKAPVDASQPLPNEKAEATSDEPLLAAATSPSVSASMDIARGQIVISAQGGAFSKSWGVSFEVVGSLGTRWVAASQQADGSWTAILQMGDFVSGSLTIRGWANCGSEPAASYGSASVKIPSTQADMSLSYDPSQNRLLLSACNVSCPTGVSFISIGVTSPSGITRWYALDLQADGTWATLLNPADFNWESGTYALTGSICDAAWNGKACGSERCSISFGSEKVSGTLETNGTLSLKAQGGRYAHAWGVSFAVTGSQGTSWIAATRQNDGTWKASMSSAQVGSGTLQIAAWANLSSTPAFAPASTSLKIPKSQANLSLNFDAKRQRIVIRATDVYCPSGVTFVSVGLTSPRGVTAWHQLSQQSDGSWVAYVNPSTYDWQSGSYTAVASICDATWKGVEASSIVSKINYGTETLSATTSSNGSDLSVVASGGRYAQAWNVSFQVSSPSKSSWAAATKQKDGSWTLNAPSSTWNGGRLTINAYASLGSETVFLGSTQITTPSQIADFSCTPQPKNDSILAIASGGEFNRAVNVAFEVYNLTEGASSTSWYQAVRQSDGSWSTNIPAANQGVGTCVAKAWATTSGGTTKSIKSTQYTYSVVPTIVSDIYLGSGDYNVSYGMSGLKVQRIQQALGIGNFNYPRYLDATVSAVKSFQSRVGLPVTGIVDRTTWISLGLDSQEWYTLGAYASPVRVSATASAAERVEAMIGRAQDYLGDPYVWDAAGAPGQGVDCAGLVMQSLYAAGLSTGIINPVTHATTAWGDHDASNYYNYGGFTKKSLSERLRGDLIYYGSNSAIDHVAIYLGNDQIIEAYPNNVRISNLWKANVLGVTRVFS